MSNSTCPAAGTSDNTRTPWNIIYNCALTVFACTWLAIHPNIPDQREGRVGRFFRRASLMIMAVIAPELVVAWAARQWLVARRLAAHWKAKGKDWTQTHGFFALMGGFALCDEDYEPTRTLNPDEDLDNLDPRVFPHITREQIHDRSKADFLSKGLVVLQTAWFLVQSIARKTYGLDVTELEIVTCAFAGMTFFIYALWWNKPLNVDCPYLIRLDSYPHSAQRETSSSTVVELLPRNSRADSQAGGDTRYHSISAHAKEYITRSKPADMVDDVLDAVMIPFRPFVEMVTENSPAVHDWRTAPRFYSGGLNYHEGRLLFYFSLSIATIFGAIHCIAWPFKFPSPAEHWIWITSSALITGIPIYGMLVISIYRWTGTPDWLDIPYKFTSVVACVLYVVARIALLVIAFTTLRNLDCLASQAVEWTNHIPHLSL